MKIVVMWKGSVSPPQIGQLNPLENLARRTCSQPESNYDQTSVDLTERLECLTRTHPGWQKEPLLRSPDESALRKLSRDKRHQTSQSHPSNSYHI